MPSDLINGKPLWGTGMHVFRSDEGESERVYLVQPADSRIPPRLNLLFQPRPQPQPARLLHAAVRASGVQKSGDERPAIQEFQEKQKNPQELKFKLRWLFLPFYLLPSSAFLQPQSSLLLQSLQASNNVPLSLSGSSNYKKNAAACCSLQGG